MMMLIMCLVFAAGVASAAIIYSQDFAADPGITAVADNAGFTPTTYAYETWLHTRALYDAGTQSLKVRSNTNGGTRGAGLSIAASNFAAGDYTISFDVATVDGSNFPLLGFSVYGMGYGGTTDYRFDFVEAAGTHALVRTGSPDNYRTTIIPDLQISSAGSYSYDVTLTGTNDLCLVFSGMSALGNEQSVYLDNVVVQDVIPEPATIGLMAVAAGGIFAFRRKRI